MRLRWFLFLFSLFAVAQNSTRTINVLPSPAPNSTWTDTGVDLRPGDTLVITADGTLQLPQGKTCGPDGQARGFRDLLKAYPANDAGLGALIGRIGSSDVAQPFVVGATKAVNVRRVGRLFLGINQQGESIDGSYQATIAFTVRGPEKPAIPKDLKLPSLT